MCKDAFFCHCRHFFSDIQNMKKYLCLFLSFIASSFIFAQANFSFGLGSGYVFYGDSNVKDLLADFDQTSQVIACSDFSVAFPLAKTVKLAFGLDSILDARWKGSQHIILWDYCVFGGFNVYPGLAGLFADVQYCFGRRTDFYSLKGQDDEIESTGFGNGFAFGFGYDFGYDKKGWAPQVGASWRHMPRGGSSDNILEVKFHLQKS